MVSPGGKPGTFNCLFILLFILEIMTERNEQERQRLAKLQNLRESGFSYPNNVSRNCTSAILKKVVVAEPPESGERFSLAGRIVQNRIMGKAAFFHVLDQDSKFQCYVRKEDLGEEAYADFKKFDIGDIVELSGFLFNTKTGEPTIHVEKLRLLSKNLIPLPEKFHGLTDVEARYRHRYVDLIANPEVREVFKVRARIIKEIRSFLDDRGFIEVETPVLQQIAGGGAAKPFMSHYNALSSDVYLRIALELPLKKLIVGGLEKVYELGRVFRNEGLSRKHNPEFTMIEFYEAYVEFEHLMNQTEEMLSGLVSKICGSQQIEFGEKQINFAGPWPRVSMKDSIHKIGGVDSEYDLDTLEGVQAAAKNYRVPLEEPGDWGRSLEALFDELVEKKLVNPTFITHHPFSISPLARKNAADPKITDRFELFICGMEVANAFSELNDPIDQRERFEEQARRKESGDEEAQEVDDDYLRAMEYGMPPTGGQGIGIDRLVMLLTNSATIKDVLLFPQLKPQVVTPDEEQVAETVNQ